MARREEAEERSRLRHERYQFLTESVPSLMWSAPPDGWPDFYNERWWEYTGLLPGQFPLGVWAWPSVLHPDDLEQVRHIWSEAVHAGQPFRFEARLRRVDGVYRWHLVQSHPRMSPEGTLELWVGTAVDIDDYRRTMEELLAARRFLEERVTERTAALEQEIQRRRAVGATLEQLLDERTANLQVAMHQANHDPLTHLPNRSLLRDRVRKTQERHDHFALIVLDLDDFKPVNDAFGHAAGDLILLAVARRLRRLLRSGSTVARLGGDEFVILLPGLDAAGALQVAERVITTLQEPLSVGGAVVRLRGSAGIALYPQHGDNFELLLERADTAMYRAKRCRTGIAIHGEDTVDLDEGERFE